MMGRERRVPDEVSDTRMRSLDRLLEIMARLRDPECGCPWDREQDFSTIAPYTIEEAYEVADAIARGDTAALKDELGDLLFQVVFHARIAEEQTLFAFEDVAAAIADKMERRHPHVFGNAQIESKAAQGEAWEAHKAAERRDRAQASGAAESVLDGVALALPALLRADKIQRRAARIGFDWPDARPVFDKLREEIAELESELQKPAASRALEDEMGDILFTAANLARKLDIDPETALRRATAKFERRFRRVETLAAERAAGSDLESLEALWQQVKREEHDEDAGAIKSPPLRLERLTCGLPAGFDAMQAESQAEGYRSLERLGADWAANITRFDRAGEALFAAYSDRVLAGIGGLTMDPTVPDASRMRRFYVRTAYRRSGIGRALATALLDYSKSAGRLVTVNAATDSTPFWESLGFVPDRRDGHTHILPTRIREGAAGARLPVSVKGVLLEGDRVVLLLNERDEWELPGGRLESGEDAVACLEREFAEELGVAIVADGILDCWLYQVLPGKDVLIVTYAVRRINRREFRVSQEHRKFGVFELGELTGLAMPEGYRRSIRACAARRASSRC
jgi:ATP diphosphatase